MSNVQEETAKYGEVFKPVNNVKVIKKGRESGSL